MQGFNMVESEGIKVLRNITNGDSVAFEIPVVTENELKGTIPRRLSEPSQKPSIDREAFFQKLQDAEERRKKFTEARLENILKRRHRFYSESNDAEETACKMCMMNKDGSSSSTCCTDEGSSSKKEATCRPTQRWDERSRATAEKLQEKLREAEMRKREHTRRRLENIKRHRERYFYATIARAHKCRLNRVTSAGVSFDYPIETSDDPDKSKTIPDRLLRNSESCLTTQKVIEKMRLHDERRKAYAEAKLRRIREREAMCSQINKAVSSLMEQEARAKGLPGAENVKPMSQSQGAQAIKDVLVGMETINAQLARDITQAKEVKMLFAWNPMGGME